MNCRFAREGHLSLYKLDQLIPQEVDLKKSDLNFLNFLKEDITHSGVRKNAAVLAKFLNISEIAKPNFIVLFKRYCEDLNLPSNKVAINDQFLRLINYIKLYDLL